MKPVRVIHLYIMAALMMFPALSGSTRAQEEQRKSDSAIVLVPDRESKRGDYDVEHYKVKQGDLLQIKMRGRYTVIGVEEENLLLKPLPNQKGLLNSVWKIPAGRSHMGNHHRIVVKQLSVKDQTAVIALEYKVRWHIWDINF
jgi:hypothetical protein